MNHTLHLELIAYLKQLREKMIAGFETFEEGQHHFLRNAWEHHSGGGGEIALLRGKVFEKAAVNWSAVSGDNFPLQESSGPFFATGVSLITHMHNPYAPTVHFNIRYIQTSTKQWFGGGYDLTPMGFPFEEDREHFHKVARESLAPFGIYEEYSKNASEYFYIPHRKKERGLGGIFFDHLASGDFMRDLALWKTVGDTFLEAILPIYKRRVPLSYTLLEREKQLEARAHYVEFNLLYDRGTKFGFASGGNPDAILCSMPPLVKW